MLWLCQFLYLDQYFFKSDSDTICFIIILCWLQMQINRLCPQTTEPECMETEHWNVHALTTWLEFLSIFRLEKTQNPVIVK